VNILPRLAGVVRKVVWRASHDFAVLVMPLLFFDVLDAQRIQTQSVCICGASEKWAGVITEGMKV
jgi:hypothetical protein